jgi:hypothetical protein
VSERTTTDGGLTTPDASIDWIERLSRRRHVDEVRELVRQFVIVIDGIPIGVAVWWYPRQQHYVGFTDHAIKTRLMAMPYRRSQPFSSAEQAAYDALSGLLALYTPGESPECFVKVSPAP